MNEQQTHQLVAGVRNDEGCQHDADCTTNQHHHLPIKVVAHIRLKQHTVANEKRGDGDNRVFTVCHFCFRFRFLCRLRLQLRLRLRLLPVIIIIVVVAGGVAAVDGAGGDGVAVRGRRSGVRLVRGWKVVMVHAYRVGETAAL